VNEDVQSQKMAVWIQAGAAMLRLAQPFFREWSLQVEPRPLTPEIDVISAEPRCRVPMLIWIALRGTCETLHTRRSIELKPKELVVLRMALNWCPPGPDVDFLNSLTFKERD
jgi:hypothetical protein